MKVLLVFFIFITTLFSCITYFQGDAFLKGNYYNFIPKKYANIPNNPLFEYSHIPPWAYEKRQEYYLNIKYDLNHKEWAKELNISVKDVINTLYGRKKPTNIDNKEYVRYLSYLNKVIDIVGKDIEYDMTEIEKKETLKQARKLINLGIKLSKETNSRFFKLRYAYNIVRIYHNFHLYSEEIKYIKSIQNLRDVKSIVWEWIDSYEAGAYQHIGKRVLSAYKFAKVFQTHKSDAYIGYYDFNIKSDKEWKSLLSLAKSSEEKIIFHFLRGVQQGNSLLAELENMIKISPKSKYIDISTYMVAQKAQFKYFNKSDNAKVYIENFLHFLQNKAKKSRFDNYLLSYFYLLTQNKKPEFNSPVLTYLYYIKNLKSVDEDKLSTKLLKLKKITSSEIFKNIKLYTMFRLSQLYPKYSIKRVLAMVYDERYSDSFNMLNNLKLKTLNEYMSLKNKRRKNYIETLLLQSQFKPSKDEIIKYYSILYTANGEFKKALKMAKKLPIPKQVEDDYYFEEIKQRVSCNNPFNTNLSGDNRGKRCRLYSHKKFLKTMLKIEKKSTAIDYFLRANGWYNISTFGNSPMFAMIYRSTVTIDKPTINDERKKLEKAKKFYKKALSMSKKREFKAKILYQLMKIAMDEEILKGYENGEYDYEKPEFTDFIGEYRKGGEIINLVKRSRDFKEYFKKFKEFKDTKYYKKRINQCATFKYYK